MGFAIKEGCFCCHMATNIHFVLFVFQKSINKFDMKWIDGNVHVCVDVHVYSEYNGTTQKCVQLLYTAKPR